MRETCARVLAAALMTGAIATALGLPALFGSAQEVGRGLVTPPSSHQRSVRVPALAAPPRPVRAERLVRAQSVKPARARTRPAVVRTPARRRVVLKPAPAPAPQPEPEPAPERLLTATVHQPEPEPEMEPEREPEPAKPKKEKKEKKPAPEVAPAEVPPPAEEEQGHGKDKDEKKHDKRKD